MKEKEVEKGRSESPSLFFRIMLTRWVLLALQEGFRYQRWRPYDGQWPSEWGICLCMRARDTFYHGPRSTCKNKTCSTKLMYPDA